MEYIKKGIITAVISQDPFAQGYDPLIHLYNHIVDSWKPLLPRLLTQNDMINIDNLNIFWNLQK